LLSDTMARMIQENKNLVAVSEHSNTSTTLWSRR
jgi:hypothetical protein